MVYLVVYVVFVHRYSAKMESGNSTAQGASVQDHSMKVVMKNHQIELATICGCALVLGLPMAVNTWWHLQESL